MGKQTEFEFLVTYKWLPYWRKQMNFPFFQEWVEYEAGCIYCPYIPLTFMGCNEPLPGTPGEQLLLWPDPVTVVERYVQDDLPDIPTEAYMHRLPELVDIPIRTVPMYKFGEISSDVLAEWEQVEAEVYKKLTDIIQAEITKEIFDRYQLPNTLSK